MKIFIDFDDVLFNTKKLKSEIIKIFSRYGISKKDFYATYRDFPTRKKGKLSVYDPEKHFKKIEPKIGEKIENLKNDFWDLVKNSKNFVFKDVVVFLSKFHKRELHLLSFGDGIFQRCKIKNSGLLKYFSDVVITDSPKGEAIREIIKKNKIKQSEKLYFIDDREMFIKDAKKKNNSIVTFLVKRKEGRYSDKKTKYCDWEVKNLNQALKIINKIKNAR